MAGAKKLQSSFIGGRPWLAPDDIYPVCEMCGSKLSFFFQIDLSLLPDSPELILGLFACTCCEDSDFLIPPFPKSLQSIDSEFFKSYQRTFRILVTPKSVAVPRVGCPIHVDQMPLSLLPDGRLKCESEFWGVIGGQPTWIDGAQRPMKLNNRHPFKFVLQLHRDWHYPMSFEGPCRRDDLHRQLYGVDKSWYDLFYGNEVYVFLASDDKGMHFPIVIVQK